MAARLPFPPSPPASLASATYFDHQHTSYRVPARNSGNHSVHSIDSLHKKPSTSFDYPPNAIRYAHRALPPLPPLSTVPPLKKCCSYESICSPTTTASNRSSTATRKSCEKSLPPVPPLSQCPSVESIASKRADAEQAKVPRGRTGRGMSFRGILNRYSSSSNSGSEGTSLTSSVSSHDSRTDSVMGEYAPNLAQGNGTATPSLSRRGSHSAMSIRVTSKKVHSSPPPPLPTRPAPPRKHSSSNASTHRWNPFRSAEDEKEDLPPMPPTPSFVQELSFTRCYYFFARNCNGYVLSKSAANGDACEACANAGYLGSL